ncbi:MAG: 50S ribosomal protein L2 [Candidatus Eisenbacteria bacterium]|nr:50S ribosomal protein L2 [Candidatus Eisenbacteria bacterium]
MGLKKHRPLTPTLRYRIDADYSDVTKSKPEKNLVVPLKKTGGRNNYGHITSYHIGGGHKRKYRMVDFKRDKDGIPAKVKAIEYDPNRSARIALLCYADGEKRYILAPLRVSVGDKLLSGSGAEIRDGNCLPLKEIPLGASVHCVELVPGRGGQLARSAGSFVSLAARENGFAHLKLPSGEVRMVKEECRATLGQVGNLDFENIVYGKAGKTRWLGRKPITRGVAMNPVDHPLGGGEGKSSGGRHPVTPWGVPTKGYKTGKKNKPSSKYILKRRK